MSGRSSHSTVPAVVPAVLAATALVVVLATWASAIGADRVFRDGGTPDPAAGDRVTGSAAPEPDEREDEAKEDDDDSGWGATAVAGVEIALLLLVVYVLVMMLRRIRWYQPPKRRWRRRRRQQVAFEVLPAAPEQAAEEIVRDADRQLELLRDGTPRNGIVACWHRFEVQAEAAGIGREPWETSAEFTIRVLDLVSADVHAVAALSELYREARFSDHELGETARAGAVEALERIHRGLGARHARGRS